MCNQYNNLLFNNSRVQNITVVHTNTRLVLSFITKSAIVCFFSAFGDVCLIIKFGLGGVEEVPNVSLTFRERMELLKLAAIMASFHIRRNPVGANPPRANGIELSPNFEKRDSYHVSLWEPPRRFWIWLKSPQGDKASSLKVTFKLPNW